MDWFVEECGVEDSKDELLLVGVVEETHMLEVKRGLNGFCQQQTISRVVDVGLAQPKLPQLLDVREHVDVRSDNKL